MDENNKNDLFDLGSEPVEVDFDPFAEDDGDDDSQVDMPTLQEAEPEVPDEDIVEIPAPADVLPDSDGKTSDPVATPKEAEKSQQDDTEKPPVFECRAIIVL